MIDRTQLTEAVNTVWEARTGEHNRALIQAARLLLDFPTDEMVEAVQDIHDQHTFPPTYPDPHKVLEAVRQVMYGDTDG